MDQKIQEDLIKLKAIIEHHLEHFNQTTSEVELFGIVRMYNLFFVDRNFEVFPPEKGEISFLDEDHVDLMKLDSKDKIKAAKDLLAFIDKRLSSI